MSILRVIVIWLSGVMLFISAFVLLLPAELYIEETLTVPHNQDAVWRKIRYFEYLKQWHPWIEEPGPVTPKITGEDGSEGSLIEYPSFRNQNLSVRHIAHTNPILVSLRIRGMEHFNRSNLNIELMPRAESTQVSLKFKANLPVLKKLFILWQEKKISKNLQDALMRLALLLDKEPEADKRQFLYTEIDGDSCVIMPDTMDVRSIHSNYFVQSSKTLTMWMKDRDLNFQKPVYLRFDRLKDSVPVPFMLIAPRKTPEWFINNDYHDTLFIRGMPVFKHNTWLSFETSDYNDLFSVYAGIKEWAEKDSVRIEKPVLCVPLNATASEPTPTRKKWVLFYNKEIRMEVYE